MDPERFYGSLLNNPEYGGIGIFCIDPVDAGKSLGLGARLHVFSLYGREKDPKPFTLGDLSRVRDRVEVAALELGVKGTASLFFCLSVS
jgi:hypothetical protein